MAGRRRSRAASTGTRRGRYQAGLSHTTLAGAGARADAHAHAHAHAEAPAAQRQQATASSCTSPLGSPPNTSTRAYCRQCKSNIGDFYNSWHRVTGSYFVPALLGSYSHLLRSTGKVKAASKGNHVEGCTIQPLSCPGPLCADSPIAFTVVEAPAAKRKFRGRDFFKLSRIELRCTGSDDKSIVVEPQEDTAPDLLTLLNSPSPTPDPSDPRPDPVSAPAHPEEEAMEIDSRPPLPPPAGLHRMRHEHQHHDLALSNQPLPQFDASKKTLPSLSMRSPQGLPPLHTIPPPKLSNSPFSSTSPAVKPILDIQHPHHLPPVDAAITQAGGAQELPPVLPPSRSPHELQHANGQPYPRSPPEAGIDALERLQAQVSQNSNALAAHAHELRRGDASFQQLEEVLRRDFQDQIARQGGDIRRLDDALARLHLDMQDMRQAMESINVELHASRVERQSRSVTAPPSQVGSIQDSALEMMTQQIAIMAQKTNEVDTLKITIEIMKNKIQRLEEAVISAPQLPSQPVQPVYHSPTEPVPPASQHAAPYHPPPGGPPHATPVQLSKTQSFPNYGTPSSAATPEMAQHNTWNTVNAGLKRSHQPGVESPQEGGPNSGSPKRQRIGAEPHAPLTSSQMHVDSPEIRTHPYPPTLSSQNSIPESNLASQPRHATYIPYGTQEAPPDDSWRPESQRIVEHRPRGRGRGGGPGSRGGRVRKSLPAQHGHAASEWEKSEWQYSEPQPSPDGFHNHVVGPGRGIARRGSGGGGSSARGGYGERAVSLGIQGVAAGISVSTPHDPYAHTKKTRTKPVRNADGVLIRKDGRPDMRSQSSAANLRKVHARKEGDPNLSPSGFTPANLQHSTSADAPETPSPTTRTHTPDQNVTDSVHKKHTAIMDKIFPSGVDESRKEHDYTRQVFEDDQDHIVYPRKQNHGPSIKSLAESQKEQMEQDRHTDVANSEKRSVSREYGTEDQTRTVREHSERPERTPGETSAKETPIKGESETSAVESALVASEAAQS